ncbi:hypothetical protein AB0G00_19100 [Nocardia salmonicida]|uniref:TY-Chap domain-containing protein n=1 Tax=Nocardia salmonicida TaxID=53431 RepID=UPI0033C415FD
MDTGVVVVEDGWARLTADLPLVLHPDWDHEGEMIWPEDGDSLHLRDTLTGQRMLFRAEDKGLEITVTVPRDPVSAARLRAVLQSQRTTSFSMTRDWKTNRMVPLEQDLWNPVRIAAAGVRTVGEDDPRLRGHARQWRTGWRHNAAYRDEIAAAIVAVLRDGLGTTPAQLRVTTYNNRGPVPTHSLGAVADDRPTWSGLPARCSDWTEFTARFEWVLTTLPWLGNVILSVPDHGNSTRFIQFCNSGDQVTTECMLWDNAGIALPELVQRMSGLGWHWAPEHLERTNEPIWLGPHAGVGTANPTMRELAALTAVTLRDIAGATHPTELACEAFANARDADDMSYVGTELGIGLV